MASALAGLAGRETGRRLMMLDPNIRLGLIPDAEYRERLRTVISQSTIVKASDTDAAWLYPDLDYEHAAGGILAEGVRLGAVTRGAHPGVGADGGFRLRVPAAHGAVVDATRASDTL